jgi:hypothetical protein
VKTSDPTQFLGFYCKNNLFPYHLYADSTTMKPVTDSAQRKGIVRTTEMTNVKSNKGGKK